MIGRPAPDSSDQALMDLARNCTVEMDREREHISALAGVRRAAIRQLAIDQGMPLAEIGKQLGISRQQVWRLLRHGSAAEQWDQECQEFGCHDTGLDSYPQGGVER